MATAPLHLRADRLGFGISLMLISWFLFTLTDTTVKWLVLAGLPVLQLAFLRYFVHFLMTLGTARGAVRHMRQLSLTDHGLLLLRGVLLASATGLNFVALNHLPLTVTSAIMFSSPVIVSALSGPLLGERVGPVRWAAILLGFGGVLVVVRPFNAEFHWAALLIVYNAFAIALFSIITRRLSDDMPADVMQFSMGVVGTLAFLPALWLWQNPTGLLGWVLLLGPGLFAWAGHSLFANAHRYAEASVLMPFTYSFILYMTGAGYLVFGDLPDGATALGAVLIIGSGLIIWQRENRQRAHG